ncbi:hypothetical protein DFQ30_011005 [Apophysomyces sp. BC1015]|nr:hypothetical protein DFQ30_011005 [Apophysomyces sp. BC1015]
MIDNLPSEIVTNIVTRLSHHRLCICIRVCRSWYAALIPVLYSNVAIQGWDQFYKSIQALCGTNSLSPINHLVRKISLRDNITVGQFASLPWHFPSIVELDYTIVWTPELSPVLQAWNKLENIRMSVLKKPRDFPLDFLRHRVTSFTIGVDVYPEWLGLVAELRCTEYLRALRVGDSTMRTARISLRQFEALHEALPRLHTFEIDGIAIYGEMPERVTPCDRLRTLTLNRIDGLLWGQYFAQKYKNLEKLRFGIGKEFNGDEEAEAMVLARSCQGLRCFHFCWNPCFYNTGERFMKIFRQIGAPIANLALFDTGPSQYAISVNRFHRTLSHISLRLDDITFEELILPLKACVLLKDLRLHGARLSIELDHILDYWKHLRHLCAITPEIRLRNNYIASNGHHHRLSTLRITGLISEEVFPYLSRRCPRLSSLEADFLFYYQPCVIHLPNPNIEKLSVLSSANAYYKVSHVRNTNQIQERNKDEARWFRVDVHRSSLYELSPQEIDILSDEYDKQELTSNGNSREPFTTVDRKHIMWIQCHNVAELYLGGKRVRCLET